MVVSWILRFPSNLVDHFVIPNLPLLMFPERTFLFQKWTYCNLMICLQLILACWNLHKVTSWNHYKFQLSSSPIGYNDQFDYLAHICWRYLSSHMEDHLISTCAPDFPQWFCTQLQCFPIWAQSRSGFAFTNCTLLELWRVTLLCLYHPHVCPRPNLLPNSCCPIFMKFVLLKTNEVHMWNKPSNIIAQLVNLPIHVEPSNIVGQHVYLPSCSTFTLIGS